MSTSPSQEELAKFTGSSIKQSENHFPSSLTLPSTSQSSNDREILLDEYQKKMGDMLQLQKDLCMMTNQMSKVIGESKQKDIQLKKIKIEKETKEGEANKRIQDLETENRNHIQNELIINNKVIKWKTRCRQYQEIMEKQNLEIKKKEETIQDYINQQKEIEKQNKLQIDKLNQLLEMKNSELTDHKLELADLKQKSAANGESIIDQQKKINEYIRSKEEMENIAKKLKEDKEELKKKLRQSSDDSAIHQATISDQINVIQKLRKDKAAYKDKYAEMVTKNEQLQKQVDLYSNLPQKVQELEEMYQKAQKLYEKEVKKTNSATSLLAHITSLVGEAYKPKDIFLNVQKVCQERDMLKEKLGEIENQKQLQSVDSLKQSDNDQKKQIQTLLKRINDHQYRSLVMGSIEKARKEIHGQIIHIGNIFGFGKETLQLKTVIFTVLFSHRLSDVLNKPNSYQSNENLKYVTDNRNWWWMTSNDLRKINDLTSSSAKTLKEIKIEREELSSNLDSERKKTLDLDSQIQIQNSKLNEDNKSLTFLRAEIRRLNTELTLLIDPKTYSELQNTYVSAKKQVKELKQKEIELINLNKKLSEQVEELSITTQDQASEITVLQEEIEISKTQIEKLTENIRILEKSHIAKNKELLSLERGIYKVKNSSDRSNAQCRALALENQNLFNQLHPGKGYTSEDIATQSNRVGLKSTRTLL